jgi:hypothetical protein
LRTCQAKTGKNAKPKSDGIAAKKGKAVYLHGLGEQNYINVNAGIGGESLSQLPTLSREA